MYQYQHHLYKDKVHQYVSHIWGTILSRSLKEDVVWQQGLKDYCQATSPVKNWVLTLLSFDKFTLLHPSSFKIRPAFFTLPPLILYPKGPRLNFTFHIEEQNKNIDLTQFAKNWGGTFAQQICAQATMICNGTKSYPSLWILKNLNLSALPACYFIWSIMFIRLSAN